MKIAVFASSTHPHLGGVEELVQRLAQQYQSKGHDVIVVTNRWPRDLPKNEIHEGVHIARFPLRRPIGTVKSLAMYAMTTRATRRSICSLLKARGVDVIHVQCVSSNGLYALDAARRLGLPLVVTAQGELTMDASAMYQRDLRAQALLQRLARRADAFTGCSRKTLADVEAYLQMSFGPRGHVIFNGTDVQQFADGVPYRHGRPYVFALGRLVPQKGMDVLIEAVALAGATIDADVLIAGEGPERVALQDLAARHGLTHRVQLVGRASRSEAASYMKGAEVVVVPSRVDEGLPLVAIEAMASGSALLVTDTGGIREAATDETTALIVAKNDPAVLASALARLFNDKETRLRLGAAAQEASSRFDWGRLADEYLSLFEAVRLTHRERVRHRGDAIT